MGGAITTHLSISGSAECSAILGHTGREVKGAEALRQATEWAQLTDREELLAHPVCREFASLILTASFLTDDEMILFRGRGVTGPPPTAERMGPPPLDHLTKGGRYDRPGDHMLYLSDCEDGTRREYDQWYETGSPYVQRYRLPLDKLRIADFTDWPTDHLVTAVFSKAEECNVMDRGTKSYLFSQTVAELVAGHFDGMRVPGVRGVPKAHYSNVVIFKPYPHWPSWLERGAVPYKLRTSSWLNAHHEHIAVAAFFIWERDGKVHGRDVEQWYEASRQISTAEG